MMGTGFWLGCGCLLAALVSPASSAAPPRDLAVLVVVGAGGADEYEARFHHEAEAWRAACARAGVACHRVGMGEVGKDGSDAAALRGWIERFVAGRKEALWLVMVGHGSFDGREARFNLRGPDISPGDLASWLKPLSRDLVVINTASASAPFLKALAGPRRVIITATKSPDEVFATRFGGYLARAVAGEPEADQDGDRQVSLLEAFLWGARQVARFYEEDGRLATEHALLDDNGDGEGTRAEAFDGLRLIKPPADGKTPDGLLARQWALVLSEEESRLGEALRRRRDELEREAETLRARKGAMEEDDYYRALERVFLEMAKLYRQEGG